MRRTRRRGQISMFILFGIVFLVFFSLTLYLRNLSVGVQAETETEQATDALLRTTTVRQLVTECLEEASTDALFQIGRQGGFIFEDQEHALIDWEIPSADFDGTRVAYQLYSDIGSKYKDDRPTLSESNYPCNNNLLVEGASVLPTSVRDVLLPRYEQHVLTCPTTYTHHTSIENNLYTFGSTGDPEEDIQPALCKSDIKDERRVFECLCFADRDPLDCEFSIQSQLEHLIAQKTLGCFLSGNANLSLPGLSIQLQDITANLTLSNANVFVELHFPVRATREGVDTTEVLQYSASVPVRLKRIYSLLFGGDLPIDVSVPPNRRAISEENFQGVLRREIDDVSYDIARELQELANERVPGLVVSSVQITDPQSEHYLDTLIMVNDTQSIVDDEYFRFQFMVENRRPALDYFSQNRKLPDYDVFASVGDTILIDPVGVDPDGDALSYTYSGWKADEEECRMEQGVEVCEPPREWTTSILYTTVGCVNPLTGTLQRERCGTYTVETADIGTHATTVTIEDPKGQRDSQTIRILINDRPVPTLRSLSDGCMKEDGTTIPDTFPLRKRTSEQDPFAFSIDCGDLSGGRYEYEWFQDTIDDANRLTSDDISCNDPSVVWSGNKIVMVADECALTCEIRRESILLTDRGQSLDTPVEIVVKVKDRFQSEGTVTPSLAVNLKRDSDADGFCVGVATDADSNDNDASIYPGAPEVCNDNRDNNGDGKTDCEDLNCVGEPSISGDICCDGSVDVCGGDDVCFSCINNVCTAFQNTACPQSCHRCNLNGECVAAYEGQEDPDGPGICTAPFSCVAGGCIQ